MMLNKQDWQRCKLNWDVDTLCVVNNKDHIDGHEQGGIYVVLVMKNQDDNLNNDKGMQ